MIPKTKQTAVKNALQATFGTGEFEDIRELTGDLTSALVYRIVVKGKPYLLRIITRDDVKEDRVRQYSCMKMAAGAGIAPRVWYTNVEDKVSITDFIEAQPFSIKDARAQLPGLIRRLHALPPFPKLMNYFETIDIFVRRFQELKLLPAVWTDEVFRQYARRLPP
jgi:hypothetical protein